MLMLMVLLFICAIFTLSKQSNQTAVESFSTIEMEVAHNDANSYVPSNFQLECSRALIKPNDCKFTNIIHFIKNKDRFKFIGVTPYQNNYHVIAPNTSSIDLVKDIPKNSVIYYSDEDSLAFFQQLMIKIYKKEMDEFVYEPITADTGKFINNHCDSYDLNNNVFIDYLSKPNSDSSFFVFGLNTHFDSKLYRYYNSYFGNGRRVRFLQLIDNDPYTPTLMKYTFFTSAKQNSVNADVVSMDDVIYTDAELSDVDIERLMHNNYIDFDKSRIYMDVYDCKIPDVIEQNIQHNETEYVYETDKYNLRKYKNSCDKNYPTNEQSINSYKNFRCIDGNNYFIDIVFPFISEYDIKLSELDFNELIIHHKTFDGVVPIRKVNPKHRAIDRYKINVNPDKYPIDSFIDDIYYSTDIYEHGDGNTYSVLTNSVPFEYDDENYEIVTIVQDNKITYYIKSADNTNIASKFTMKNGLLKTVVLQEGDRIFLKNDSISDAKLQSYLANKLQIDGENYYHGTVIKGTNLSMNNKPYQNLVIKLFNIRKNVDSLQGACFDSNWEASSSEMLSIKTKEECESKNKTWDTRCRYNYECPFYKENKNYPNFRGGCLPNGFCEMPVGIKLQSFRKFEKNNKDSYPLCYNCPPEIKDTQCCDEQQKMSENADSIFKSADYLFYNDSGDRKNKMFQTNDECNKKSLKINKYI